MDDFLDKIKHTEEEANNIINEAEENAKKIIEKTRLNASVKLSDEKHKIAVDFNKIKKEKIKESENKKEKLINDKIEEFTKNLGDFDKRKKRAKEYLISFIKNKSDL